MNTDLFSYTFPPEEIKNLVRFMRIHESEIGTSVAQFYTAAEKHLYSSLTIEEAQQFFYEK